MRKRGSFADARSDSQDKILRSVPGAGVVLSATMLGEPGERGELGAITGAQISSLVGVAPYNFDSGTMRGKRAIRGGRSSVRNVLFMAGVYTIQRCPIIRCHAERPKAAGKPPKVIIVAAMSKPLTIINAMIRDQIQRSQLKIVQQLT